MESNEIIKETKELRDSYEMVIRDMKYQRDLLLKAKYDTSKEGFGGIDDIINSLLLRLEDIDECLI